MHSFTIKDKEIKVESIMKKIDENVKEKKKAGLYKDKDIQNISGMKIDLSDNSNLLKEHDPNLNRLESHRKYLSQNWDSILKGVPVKSHRKIIGPFIGILKKTAFLLLRPIINTVLDSQARFNSELVRLLNLLTLKSRELEQSKIEIDLRLDALGDGLEYLNHFCQELDSKYDELKDKLNGEESKDNE